MTHKSLECDLARVDALHIRGVITPFFSGVGIGVGFMAD